MESSISPVAGYDGKALKRFPSPYLILRVGLLPFSRLLELRVDGTVSLIRALQQAQDWFDANRNRLSEILFELVPKADGAEARRTLLQIRRSAFNDRPPTGGSAAIRRVRSGLTPAARASLIEWYRRILRRHRLEEALARTYRTELSARRSELRRMLSGDEFLRALVLSSPDYSDALLQQLSEDRSLPPTALHVEVSGFLYLSRMAAKTSPFSTFTATALGRLGSPGPPSGVVELRRPLRTRVQLDIRLVHLLAQGLSRLPAIRPHLPAVLSPALWSREGRWFHVQRNEDTRISAAPGFRIRQLSPAPALQAIIDLLVAGPRPYGEVARCIAGGDARSLDLAARGLDRMLEAELIACRFPLSPHDPQPAETLLRLLEPYADDPLVQRCRRQLSRITTLTRVLAHSSYAERRRYIGEITGELRLLFELLGMPAEELTEAHLLHEDSAFPGASDLLDTARLAQIESDLVPVLEACALGYSQNSPWLIQWFESDQAEHGLESRVLPLLARLSQVDEGSWRAGVSKGSAFAFRIMQTNRFLRALTATVFERWREAGASDRAVMLDSSYFPPDLPDVRGHPASVTVFLQFGSDAAQPGGEGEDLVVLNRTYTGLGAFAARFCGLYGFPPEDDPLTRMLADHFAELNGPAELVDLPLLADVSNLQVHPRLTRRDLAWPGEPADPGSIAFEDLCVTYDKEMQAVRLTERSSGREVIPLYLGGIYPLLLPSLMRTGVHALTPTAYPYTRDFWDHLDAEASDPAGSNKPNAIRHLPRVRIGQLVLARECWFIPCSGVPRSAKRGDDLSYFRRIYDWKTKIGLPDIVFVRRRATTVAAIRENRHKPLYLDFQNPWSVLALPRILEDDDSADLIFTEMFPGPEQLATRVDGQPVVSELQLELNWVPKP